MEKCAWCGNWHHTTKALCSKCEQEVSLREHHKHKKVKLKRVGEI